MIGYLLGLPAVQHAFIAATLVALISGLLGPFVITRRAAFAVHGVSELSFTGAAAGLLFFENRLLGAILGSLLVAAAIAFLGPRDHERDAAIGVTLAFGLGVGVYLLSQLRNFGTQATSLLFGQIFGVSTGEIAVLAAIAVAVAVVTLVIYRPLLFSSVDPELAEARGVPVRFVGLVFLVLLALTVTEAAQIVGTTLVLCLVITPAAAAHRLSARPAVVTGLSVLIALLAADGGIFMSLTVNVTPSVPITTISFVLYLVARVVGSQLRSRRRSAHLPTATPAEVAAAVG
ncbi:MAG: zinc/manganese transport system permease protein [Pseudonocardiales bacterium]|nr:zinc/manganese transport system permease protein [Pseudonocardiales bacterium]